MIIYPLLVESQAKISSLILQRPIKRLTTICGQFIIYLMIGKYIFNRGDITKLAEAVSVSKNAIWKIRHRLNKPTESLAYKLENATYLLWGFKIPAEAWLLPDKYSNPFLVRKEKKK